MVKELLEELSLLGEEADRVSREVEVSQEDLGYILFKLFELNSKMGRILDEVQSRRRSNVNR